MHVEEDFSQRAVLVFPGPDIKLMSSDRSFLGIAGPAIGQTSVCASADGDSVGRQRLVGVSDILCVTGVMKRDFHGAPGSCICN